MDVQPLASPILEGTLGVPPLQGSAIYRERYVLYAEATTPQRLGRHHYHYWVDPPLKLVRRHLVDYLRQRQVATLVAGDDLDVRAEVEIRLQLRAFERILSADGSVRVRAAFDAQVRRRGQREPLLLARYAGEELAQGDGVSASVAAFERVLERLYGELLRDLEAKRDEPSAAARKGLLPAGIGITLG
jgi:ABC-type uncharacterized transport system auxiliary subunit